MSGFIALQNGDSIELYWDKLDEEDVKNYEIREGYSYDEGTPVAREVTGTNVTIPIDTTRVYKYFIKAMNQAGFSSVHSASATVNVTALLPRNIIETFDELALANGTHNNTLFTNSKYNWQTFGGRFSDYPASKWEETGSQKVLAIDMTKASNGHAEGTYTTPVIDVSSVITCNVTTIFYSTTARHGGGSVKLMVRISQDNETWTSWQVFKPVQRTFRYIQFKIEMAAENTKNSPEVNKFIISIDVPDTDIALKQTIAKGGSTVSYGHTFYAIPAVVAAAVGENYHAEIVSRDKTSCVIKVKDKSNNDTGGACDIRIKVY